MKMVRIFSSGRAEKNDSIILDFSQTKQMIEWIKKYKTTHLKKCKGSSIHHWQLNTEKPEFCYVYDMKKINK